jgi:hypothetical protein
MQRRQFVIGAVLGTASLVSRPAYAIGSTLKLVYPMHPEAAETFWRACSRMTCARR